MLKLRLFKRVLPVILSVAMTFQSVPMTALAAENQAVEEPAPDEGAGLENDDSDNTGEEAGDTSDAGPSGDGGSADVSADEGASQIADDDPVSKEKEPAQEEEPSSPAEETEAPSAETDPTDTEDKAPSQTADLMAKILVDDGRIDAYVNAADGFTRRLDESGLVFFTEYTEESRCGRLQDAVKEGLSVAVDGETVDSLKDRLTYSWARKAEGAGGADTPLTNAFPKDAGEYELTISMDLANLDGICSKLESDVKLSLTIEKADIEIELDGKIREIAPGKTARDLMDQINENYKIKYKSSSYEVSRDILVTMDAGGSAGSARNLPLSLFVLDKDGKRQPMAETDKFDANKDYVLTIGAVSLTENAAKNYELSPADSYVITVGERQKTEIRFERREPGKDLIERYDPGKSWSVAAVTEGLFTEEVKDAGGKVIKSGVPTVYVQGEDKEAEGEYSVLLEGVVPEAGWYTRSSVEAGYEADTDAGEILSDDLNYVYKPMTEDPKDAGEYFILWCYAGDESAYEESHSAAVRFTIDPVPVVIKTNQESVDKAGFCDGMTEEDVRKALAKLAYGVYPLVKNETTGVEEVSGTAVTTTPDFFGTSYRGDVEGQATQYYVPEFVLQRRVTRITEKDGTSATVDPEAVEWTTTGTVKVVVDIDREKDKETFESFKAELPNDVSVENLESVEFAFRVFFTGQKVVYDKDGNKLGGDTVLGDTIPGYTIPVTDVTTNAANRNYLADITKKTLEDTAVMVNVETAENVQIVTDAIVDAFLAENKDMLYPQPAEGASASDIHQGTLEDPATKIYDQKALFSDRAAYKKAKVHKYGADGGIGEALSNIAPTDDALAYRWSYTTLDEYEKYLEDWDEVQRQYKDFEEYANLGWGWTDVTDGTLASCKWAGFYRLTVTYDDPDHKYQSAEAQVFFKIERQEVVIVPTEKYAKAGDRIYGWEDEFGDTIDGWKDKLGKKIGEDFTIYRLPHNSMEEYNALTTEEEKKAYIVPTQEALAEFEANNGHKASMDLVDLEWEVLRKLKDPATGEDTAEWITVDREAVFEEGFTYGVVAHWTGSLVELESENVWENYTTKDRKTYKETGEEKHHEEAGPVRFYTRQLYAEVDAEKIKALSHEYDGDPVSLSEAAQALTFYTDKALTESSRLSTEAVVNMTDIYDPAKVNIYWTKDGNDYANKNAVYGGTYTLLLRFAGGGLNVAPDMAEGAEAVTYAPGVTLCYVNANADIDGSFTVTPREITITPKTVSSDILTAGRKASELLADELTLDDKIVEKDKIFFTYSEIAAGSFDVTWDGSNEDGTDKEGFAYKYNIDKDGGYPAFNGAAEYIVQTDGREIGDPEEEYLRFDRTYTVKLTNELASPLKESYKVTYGAAAAKIDKRGNADIADIEGSHKDLSANGIVYDLNGGAYTIKPRGAVRFFYDNGDTVNVIGKDGPETLKNTNVLGFRLYAPKEFLNDFAESKENFVYQNAVWKAGGYFLGNIGWQAGVFREEQRYYIDVVFPLTKEDKERSFIITWEDGYTETFTLADIVLEEDLTKAVAPKSMAFSGVAGKMAVGEKQQLDLKIKKAQLGDVISIRYRIKGGATKNEYISLDPEKGIVTALRAGKTATVVEAYPVYKNAKGDFVPVLDSRGKEAKVASTRITVKEVTAAGVKKIVAQGNSAKLYFTVPNDGYRREIYVVDVTKGTAYETRKKWKPADFNRAIDSMANGEWEEAGFAVSPIYSYAKNEHLDVKAANGTYDKKLKAHIVVIDNLEAQHEYAIYVRNVSAARELDDGSMVTLSASGTVRKCKTIKPQVLGLELGFTVKTGDNDKKNTVTHPVNEDGTINAYDYTVALSAKKAQLNVYGLFSDGAGGNEAADPGDLRKYSLVPTLKEEKAALKNYQMPKLEYAIHDEFYQEPFDPDLGRSEYATINNKGLISLKGVDLNGKKTIYVHVRDGMQHADDYRTDAMIELTITADPASMAGKKAKLKVGQTVRLADYLEYKDAKKKKIPGYRSCGVTITREMLAAAEAKGYRIEDREEDPLIHDWYITALVPNKAKFDLAVTDFDAEGKPMTATVSLTAAKIDPVKNLKVTYVDDWHITINFTHPANSNEEDDGCVYDYALEVKDARGNVVEKIVLSDPNRLDVDGINAKELKSVQSWFQCESTGIDNRDPKNKTIVVGHGDQCTGAFNYYTGTRTKTKTFAYTYTNEKLVRLSAYTLSVTPLFENQKADKAAKVKTKTTNIPASHANVDVTALKPDKLGGELIVITSAGVQQTARDMHAGIVDDPYRFISGNTYTLELQAIDVARDRVTDTLTWKSSNPKVASIKANAGTYTATFKAANKGKTTITVTSKVTKKVIARWAVTVYAVKDGSSFGGDYEPTWPDGFYEKILALYDPYYEGRLEVLSLNVPLVIDNSDAEGGVRTWVSFTAPHYGQYIFDQGIDGFYDSRDGRKVGSGSEIFLEAGQKVYFSVVVVGSQTLTLHVVGTELVRLTKANTKEAPLEVKAGYVSFTAWEDNVYTFWHNGEKLVVDGKTEIGMRAGETRYLKMEKGGRLYVTWRDVSADGALTIGSHPTGIVTLDKDNQVRYLSFTANTDGVYKFTYQSVKDVTVNFSAADGGGLQETYDDDAAAASDEVSRSFRLQEGEKVVIEIRALPEITDAARKLSVSVTVAAKQRRKIENGTITIPKGTTEIVEYVIPSFTTETVQFKFAVSGEYMTKIENYLNQDDHPLNEIIQANTLTLYKDSKLKAGDSIYIVVRAGGSAENKEAKDAVLTVTQVPVDTLTAGAEKTTEVTNYTQQWYTFTAPQEGYYEFGVTVAERAEGDTTPLHDATLVFHKKPFGGQIDINVNVKTAILAMKAGEMVAVKLNPGYVDNVVKEDGTEEAVKSKATVSVKALEIQPLALGAENGAKVQIPAKSSEVRYYSFTALTGADYTITWQPADPKADNAKVTYFSSMTSQDGAQTVAAKGSSIKLGTGAVRYIKVAADDLESGDAVNGTLCVTAADLSADALTIGTAYPFRLEDKDNLGGEGARKVVKFTAPESGYYAVLTTVKENPASGLPYRYPNITTDDGPVEVPVGYVWIQKGETKYFTLSYQAIGEIRETEGTITIRSMAEPFTGEQVDVSVTKDTPKVYTYTIPESGRYEFKADYDKEKAEVQWWENDGDNAVSDGNYYLRNTKISIWVSGLDEDAEASVKLYKPALITTTAFTIGENTIAVNAGETKYYELSAGSEPKIFEFELTEITGTVAPVITCAVDPGNSWRTLSDGSSVSLPKDDRLVVKVRSGSEKKGVNCKLNVTERKMLALGENTVHLGAGETVNLTFRALETAYYSFYVNDPGKELAFRIESSGSAQTGDSFYDIARLTAKRTRTYKLTNEGSGAVDITVTMKAEVPVNLEPGGKTEAKTIPEGQQAYYALKVFKAAAYLIKITDTGKGDDLKVYLDGSDVTAGLRQTVDGVLLEKNLDGEHLLCLTNDGIKETTVTVELTMSEVQPLPEGAVTLAKNESRLVSFVATEDARYLITKDNEEVVMMPVSLQKIDGTKTTAPTLASGYAECCLNKGDKLIYKLSYVPDAADKKAQESQTVNVKITKIQPTPIEAESTPVTIAEKDNRSVWYQFTAGQDAVHTFTLEDTYGNKVTNRMTFYRYITDTSAFGRSERHMKAGEKVFINVKYPDAGAYTLKYTKDEALAEAGVRTLDFEYKDEVQEVKFAVPKSGTYKISATAVRGSFTVKGEVGGRTVVDSFATNGYKRSELLKKNDIVTFKVTAMQDGKSSVTLRIAEDNTADTLTLGKEQAGVSDTGKKIYHEICIEKKGLYAISAGGGPAVWYLINDRAGQMLDGVVYEELEQGDRVILEVRPTTPEKAYTVKIEEVSAVSLDGKNTEEEPYAVSTGENYYGFTTEKAYVRFKVPEDGNYYLAVQTITGNTSYTAMDIVAPAAKGAWVQAATRTLTKDQNVTFRFENSQPKNAEDPEQEYKEALFKLTVRKTAAAENPINAGETKADSLAAGESVNYQFKPAEAGTYVITFNGSNCRLNSYWGETTETTLAKDETLTLTISNTSGSKAGSYKLTVTKLVPETLALGVTAQKTLKNGETAYYEFASTETTDDGETTYQVFISGDGGWYTCKKVSAAGYETTIEDTDTNYNHEVNLKKGEKLALTVRNNSAAKTRGFKLTVKKAEHVPVKADTPVTGSLEAFENAYYAFTSEAETTGTTTYQISLTGSDSVLLRKIQKAAWEKDSEGKDKLGTPVTMPTGRRTFELKKGEKLLITMANESSKTAQFELTVEQKKEAVVTYDAIAVDEKKTGKLAADEKAGYEFTVSDAAEEGTLYGVYFGGDAACSYSRTSGEDVSSGSLSTGSNEFTWKKGDKIRFTISGPGHYQLAVKKVTYTPLTSGVAAAKTLNAGEIAYYQFTAQDDPAAGEAAVKYQVYGYFGGYSVQTRKVTTDADGKTVETGWSAINVNTENDLKKGEILQFKIRNINASKQFRLAVKKVEYSPLTLGTAAEGRLDTTESGYAYYEFISQEDPAEGQTAIKYQIYGTAYYDYSKVTVKEDNTLTSTVWQYDTKVDLAKGQRLRIRVTGSSKPAEGYSLTVAKTWEKTFTPGSKTETGSLGRRQELTYTYKYDKDTPAVYTLSYEETAGVNVLVTVNGSWVPDEQRISMAKDDTLKIVLTANKEVDNFAFTVSEFKPEPLTLGTLSGIKKLAFGEKAYYQYTVGEDGSYVLSIVESESDSLGLDYEVSRADVVVQNDTISGGIGEINLKKDDVLLIWVSAPDTKAAAAYSCRLLLQKKTAEDAMTALPWSGTLQQGEVKYLKFTVPEAGKESGMLYTVTVPYTSTALKYTFNGNNIYMTQPYYNRDTSADFVMRVANLSMYNAAECSIDVQENPYVDLGGNSREGEVAEGKTEYYKYRPGAGAYNLTYQGDAKVQYSTDGTATKSWKNIAANAGTSKIMLTDSADTIYLKISHNGGEGASSYRVSIEEAQYEVPEKFALRASRDTACIGSDTLYLYLDTDIEADQITVFYGKKGSGERKQIDLYDDGTAKHGDDIKGDGIYSIILRPEGTEDMKMQFTAEYGKKSSNTVTVSYYMPIPADLFSTMDAVDDEIDTLLSEPDFTEKTDDEKLGMVTGLLNELVETNKVLEGSIHVDEENSVVSFRYPGEILGGVMYGEFEGDFNGGLNGELNEELNEEFDGTGETPRSDERGDVEEGSYPERNTYVPAAAYNVVDTEQSQELGRALILNSFPSFETAADRIAYRTGFYETLKSEWDEAGLKTDLDTDVTVDDYRNLHNYNVVCISTHGNVYTLPGGSRCPAFCLSQKQSSENNKKYEAELKNQQIARVNGRYWILPAFFTGQYGANALDDTFVFSESCMSMGTGRGANAGSYDYRMANAFTGNGAKAYIGFHNSVFATYSREFMKEYVNNLIEGSTSGEAFDEAVYKYGSDHEVWYNATYSPTLQEAYGEAYDPSVDVAYPVHNGDRSATLINHGLQNGGFEDINTSTTAPKSWACAGDVRTLLQLGDVMPYGGESKRMAIITTGIGAKSSAEFSGGTEGSMVSQTFQVPYGVNRLRFDYDFISEEPLEYVGSQFDDYFEVRILQGSDIVLEETYESINTSEWQKVEGINFAGGDDTVFHTEWKTKEIDVSKYCGSVITLSFIIYDVGDQIYDSACVIDNVRLQ